jgi:hypothetical protein
LVLLDTSVCQLQHTFTLGIILGITDADWALKFLGALLLSTALGHSPCHLALWLHLDGALTRPPWWLWSLSFYSGSFTFVWHWARVCLEHPSLSSCLEWNGSLDMAQRKHVKKPWSTDDQSIVGALKPGHRFLLTF